MTSPSPDPNEFAVVTPSEIAPAESSRNGALSDAERLAAIIATQNAIATSDLDLPALMQLIAERTQELTAAAGAAFELREGDEMVYRAACGTTAEFLGLRLPIQGSLSGRSVLTGEILKCDDSELDTRVDREACRKVGARSMIVVPLRYQGRVQGVLKVLAPRASHFSEADVRTLESMAGLLGALVNHAAAFEEQTEAAKARERALNTLRREQEQQTRLFEAALSWIADYVFICDLQGRITYANRARLALWQKKLDEVLGKNFYELGYPAELAERIHAQIDTVIGTQAPVRAQSEYTSPSGRTGFYDYILVPVLNAEGGVEAVAGSTRDISQIQKAQDEKEVLLEQLQNERERLTEIFLRSPAFIAVLRGPEHVFERVNPPYVELVGFRELVGKSIREALPEVEAQGFLNLLDEVYRTGRPFVGNDARVLLGLPGEPMRERYLDFVYQPLVEADGAVSGIFVHGVDLTERKQVEEALRASEERVRLATEAAGLGIWVWEPVADRATWENEQMYRLVGLTPSDEPVNAARFTEMLLPEDARAFALATAEPIVIGESLWFEGRFRRADGAVRWIELRGRLQPNSGGQALRVVGTAADITERKLAEERARQAAEDARAAAEANAKFRTFFEQGSYFAGVMTLDGVLVEANRLCLEYCGYTRADVIGRQFWDCGWWNRSVELQKMIRQATQEAAAGRRFQRETHYFFADGTERYMDLIITPITDASGRVLFIAPTGTDITERNLAVQTLQEHTREIADLNQRLHRAMRETHHRVKNNLQVVAAMIEMQVLEHRADGLVPLAEFIRLKTHVHTLAIVHDILTSGIREDEEAQRISTKAVLERLLPMLQQTAWKQRVRYSVDEVVLSSKQCVALALVLNELVSNALKHGKQQSEVFFTTDGQRATLAVYDDGDGFPDGFDPDASANTGLELVNSLVRTDLRGTIRFGNQHQSGGQVIVTFPLPENEV